ncbi:hypothetical protein ACFX12_013655 [Malus domestica]
MEFTAQIQEQSEFSNSTVENLKEDFEIHDAIILGSAMEVGGEPMTSKPSQNMDEQLMLEEEESNKATARKEPPLPQPHMPSMPSTTTKVSLNSIHPDPVHQMSLFLAGLCNPRKKKVIKASSEPFQRIKSKKWMGNVYNSSKKIPLRRKLPKKLDFMTREKS